MNKLQFSYKEMISKGKVSALLLFCCLIWISFSSDRLILVQELFRHGARYPFYTIQNDNISEEATNSNKKSELTAQGRHMSYILGKLLYAKYWKALFSGTDFQYNYHPSLLEVWSTSTNRTIQSAQAQLIGLLQDLIPETLKFTQNNISMPPFKDPYQPKISDGLDFFVFGENNQFYHTTPIHTEPVLESAGFSKRALNRVQKIGGNFMTIHDKENCPKQVKWMAANLRSEEYVEILSNDGVQHFLSVLSSEIGYKVNYTSASEIIDELSVAKHLGKPSFKIFQDPQNIEIGQFIQLSHALLKFHTPFQRQVVFTNFLSTLLRNMRRAIERGQPRFILFSGHDSTLISFLAAFEMTNLRCLVNRFKNMSNSGQCVTKFPQFSASILIELWKKSSQQSYYVKILYNGEDKIIPICGHKIACPLIELENWAKKFYQEDPWEACGLAQINLPS